MLTWPHEHSDWAPLLASAEATYIQLAEAICRYEKALIVCYDAAHQAHISQCLEASACNMDHVRLVIAPSNDTWARDHGPVSVLENGTPRLLDFTFNGWGNKYDAELDNAINQSLARQGAWGRTLLQTIPFVLEGGSIDSDGQGTLLTTEACLLTESRNPGQGKQQIEALLKQEFGCKRLLWLSHGELEGDDTDGHIDTLARFCDAQTIAYVSCNDPGDSHFATLRAMEEELKALRTADGKPYRLVPLPLPAPKFNAESQRLPATYANFLIINNAVLVPTYQDPMDDQVLQALADCFPERDIIGLDALAIIQQYGSLHCITMQLPAGIIQ